MVQPAKKGEVAEWLKAPDSKSDVGAILPWVQIPPSPPFCFHYQWVTYENTPMVDATTCGMKTHGDQLVTTHENPPSYGPRAKQEHETGLRAPKRRKIGKPAAIVKFGSAAVPIYRCNSKGRERYILSYHRAGKRVRQSFCSLPEAKKEAHLVAQRIQQGLQHVTDLTPADRDAYVAAKRMLAESGTGIPLVAAIEDYLRARSIAGTESLAGMAADYSKYFKKVTRKATVPEVVGLLLEAKRQDGLGDRHLRQLKSVLTRFSAAFPGPILDVTSTDVDTWLRGLGMALSSRNSMLRFVNVLFSFALAQNFLPEGRPMATSSLKKVKVVSNDVCVFTPEQMTKLLHAAPAHLIPILAIGAFSGIRMAELARLDWSAVNLDRRIIEVRAGQAKTASRRVIPITDNLAAWLAPLPRIGKVLHLSDLQRESAALAKAVGIEWPRNVLRHSFISYRIAIVKSAEQVALEAGNSPSIIFKHYRELVSEDVAEKWFSILPKPDQMRNRTSFDRKTGVVKLLDA